MSPGRRSKAGRRLILFSVGGVALAAVVLVPGIGAVGEAIVGFELTALVAAVGLTVVNYLLRFLRWDLLLRRVSREPSLGDSALTFAAGSTMILTPGRMGEWVKSSYLRTMYGIDTALTAPIVAVERVTDGFAMLLLAGAGLSVLGVGSLLFVLPAFLLLLLLWLGLVNSRVQDWVVSATRKTSFLDPIADFMGRFGESSRILAGRQAFRLSFLAGLLIWAIECLTFFIVLVGIGEEASIPLLLLATAAFPLGTLAGTASMIPGGLGIAEGSMAGVLVALSDVDGAVASAAVLITRMVILGFGIGIGVIGALLLGRRMAGSEPVQGD